jgi:hypothetical protein
MIMAMTWNEVFKVHRIIGAMYFGGGEIKSMLFSLDKRRGRHNFKEGNHLHFCFDKDKQKSSDIANILSKLKADDTFTVYEKTSPDCWEDRGLHVCASIEDGVDASGRKSLIVTAKPVNT